MNSRQLIKSQFSLKNTTEPYGTMLGRSKL
jgi:hypothetical protein